MPTSHLVLRVVPVALALVELALVVAALHVPLARAMRERGLPRWRLRDTMLASPLALAGGLAFLASANLAVARLAYDAAAGQLHASHALPALGVAAAGATVAAFGLRALGKLF